MHARDQRVGGQNEVVARRGFQKRRVVAKAETRRTGERRKNARDEFVFGEAGGHEA
jgi:hypothetical protein